MPGVSREQVEQAREIDLLSYLQNHEPQELKPDGPGRYTTATHSSLVISNGKWNWNHGGVGGVSALDYLIKVRNVDFVSAVETLCRSCASPIVWVSKPQEQKQPEKRDFSPPKPMRYANNAVSYLQNRGINPEIIGKCIQSGAVYESRFNNAAVCMFTGKDAAGQTKFACMRGINTDIKRDVVGSDKRFGFCLPVGNHDNGHLAVFESPIDALSHASLALRSDVEWTGHRLSLGGTSASALIAFLERNTQISHIALCLDSDDAGQSAAKRIHDLLAADKRFSHISVTINPPAVGKDFNDELLHVVRLEKEQKQHSHSSDRAADFI